MTTFGDDLYCKNLNADNVYYKDLIGPGGEFTNQSLEGVLLTPGGGQAGVAPTGIIKLTTGNLVVGVDNTNGCQLKPDGSIIASGSVTSGSLVTGTATMTGPITINSQKIVQIGTLEGVSPTNNLFLDFGVQGNYIRNVETIRGKDVTGLYLNFNAGENTITNAQFINTYFDFSTSSNNASTNSLSSTNISISLGVPTPDTDQQDVTVTSDLDLTLYHIMWCVNQTQQNLISSNNELYSLRIGTGGTGPPGNNAFIIRRLKASGSIDSTVKFHIKLTKIN